MIKIKKTNSGFTIIELMTVVVMIGILSAVAIPRFNAWLPVYRLKSAASDLQSNMQKARVQAIKTNIPVQIRFDYTNSPGFYYFDTFDDDAYTAGEFRIDLLSYSSGVDFGTGNASAKWDGTAFSAPPTAAIGFGTRGTSSQATVYLQNEIGTVCYAITTSIAGTAKARIYNGNLPFNTNNWIQ
ncbi:MAG: GspH/FimT family pseudopilin [Desulfobacula sp.]|uniref:GspH/FimT family pseudopilin n=1 Tax=Desulfobacula sp. TaxID=2593537 RepID=UPI0025BB4D74|nr:GspH/FimT family pseudopilin [Desulfobacula sp.]MCD4718374.1 GspH/FimT family pseudopilin [Desulfobacula sp.]